MEYLSNPNRLLIIATSLKHAEYYKSQLNDIMGSRIGIAIYSWGKQDIATLKYLLSFEPQLILCSDYLALSELEPYCSIDKVFRSQLSFYEPINLDKLFMIPPETNVLVVCPKEIFSLQVIEMLKKLGIDHLNYIPYWDNCQTDVSDIQVAISSGTLEYCPPNIPTKIDIGLRSLSVKPILRILQTFNLDAHYIERYVEVQKNLVAQIYKNLAREHINIQQLKAALQTITEGLDEGIISINKDNTITEINLTALKQTGYKKYDVLGKDVRTIFPNNPEICNLTNISTLNTIITINKHPLYADYVKVDENEHSSTVGIIRLKEISNIQKNDERIRQLMFQKNHGHTTRYVFDDIITADPSMEAIKKTAMHLAKTQYTVLITGETGTGKELFANSIHSYSDRTTNPFVAINFAALPENLIESELFGYGEGAFTGARKLGKKGLFELAHTGTIFLDEIGDATLAVQTRLLRVLEEQVIMRVGDTKVIPVNTRVIAATNKNLKKMIEEGTFRADLYYRINAFQLRIPPLRERANNIMTFIQLLSSEKLSEQDFSPEALTCIRNYFWPGNLRELRNMVNYISVVTTKPPVEINHLPEDIINYRRQEPCDSNSQLLLLYNRLSSKYKKDEIIKLLQIIAGNSPGARVIGRIQMLSLLHKCDLDISANQLRTLLKELEIADLIHVGKTKQGTTLSRNGKTFRDWLEKGISKI